MCNNLILGNMILPLFGHVVLMFLLLWLVIAVEVWFVRKIAGLGIGRSLWVCTVANVISTIVGIPATHILTGLLCMPIGWLAVQIEGTFPKAAESIEVLFGSMFGGGPYLGRTASLDAVGIMMFLIPYYYMSVFVEYKVMKWGARQAEPKQIKKAAILMNRASYVMLGVFLLLIYLGDIFKVIDI